MADRGVTPVGTRRPATDRPLAESIVALAQVLVRIPSRGGEDSPVPIVEAVRSWLVAHEVETSVLRSAGGEPVAVLGDIAGAHPGPVYCLDACLDTAPFGDLSTWRDDPASGTIANGRLHGRGAADSKIAVAIFCHLAAELARTREELHGRLLVLFDADEHTGGFGGARAFLAEHPRWPEP